MLSDDRGTREAWDDLVRTAAEGFGASAGFDVTIIDAALGIRGPGERSLEFRVFRPAAGMCA